MFPTMINKCQDTYFIIGCWDSRVLYSKKLSNNLQDYKTLIDDNYLAGLDRYNKSAVPSE